MLNSVNADNLSKARLVYLKLKVEKGLSGSSKISKLANSFSSLVRLLTPGGKRGDCLQVSHLIRCLPRGKFHVVPRL